MIDVIAGSGPTRPVFTVIASVVYRNAFVVIVRAEGVAGQIRHVFAAVEADELAMPALSTVCEGELVVGLYEVSDTVTCHDRRRFHSADAADTLSRYFGLTARQAAGCLSRKRLAKLYAEGKTIDGGEVNAADGQ